MVTNSGGVGELRGVVGGLESDDAVIVGEGFVASD
jgi:hypothetical protein